MGAKPSGFVMFMLLSGAPLLVRPESVTAVYVRFDDDGEWVTVVKVGDSEEGEFCVKETEKRVMEILS